MIPNGFDCERFQPQPGAHAWLCHELGLPPESVLVGLIGRYHDMKDHHNLVQAAGQLAPQTSDVHFVLAGRDVTPNNKVLRQQIAEAQVSSRFHVLGERADIPRLMAGLDVLVSSSWTEGFSNVIGEAMACGAPCVVTDVGESAAIVGEAGLVVPPRDPKGLASALSALIAAGPEYRHMLGQKARRRVLDVYSMPQITRQYDSLYLELVACSRSSQGAN
jgi:glycosyltransferase involved in cell wall biosynthesis